MSEKLGSGMRTQKDLALADLRKWTPWEEMLRRYTSSSVLYAALAEFMPGASAAYDGAAKQLKSV